MAGFLPSYQTATKKGLTQDQSDAYKEYAQGRIAAGQSGDMGTGVKTDPDDPWAAYKEYTRGRIDAGQAGNVGSSTPDWYSTQGNAPWLDWMNQIQQQMSGMNFGGGGGGVYTAPPVDEGLETAALEAALARIGSEYGLRVAEPTNSLNSLSGIYQNAQLQNDQALAAAERQTNDAMAERGLYRSGIRNQEMQRAFDPIETQRRQIENQLAYGDDAYGQAVAEADFGTQALSLQAAIEQLKAAQANAELERRIEAERAGLSHDLSRTIGT